MALAQVVYHISNDQDFANAWKEDPETALQQKGLKLSKEEQAFISMGFRRYSSEKATRLHIGDVTDGMPWFV